MSIYIRKIERTKRFLNEEIAAWDYKLAQKDISTIDYAMYEYTRKFAKEVLEMLT